MRIYELGYQLINESIGDNNISVKSISTSEAEKILNGKKISGNIVKACKFIYNNNKNFAVYLFLDEKGNINLLKIPGKIPSAMLVTVNEFKKAMEEIPKNMREARWDKLAKSVIKASMISNGQLIYYKKRKK